MIQIAIDIPEAYKKMIDGKMFYTYKNFPSQVIDAILGAVRYGTPLPEHIVIVDADAEKDIRLYITSNKDSEDLYLAGCGDGAYHALMMMKDSTIFPATKGE